VWSAQGHRFSRGYSRRWNRTYERQKRSSGFLADFKRELRRRNRPRYPFASWWAALKIAFALDAARNGLTPDVRAAGLAHSRSFITRRGVGGRKRHP
jgi:hypothetical protein